MLTVGFGRGRDGRRIHHELPLLARQPPLTFTGRYPLPVKLDSKSVPLPLALQFPACAVCNRAEFITPVFVGIFGVQGFAQVEME